MRPCLRYILIFTLIGSCSTFATKQFSNSPLLPGTKVVAGDPDKNEFFILAENEKPPIQAVQIAQKERPKTVEVVRPHKMIALNQNHSVKKISANTLKQPMQIALKAHLQNKPSALRASLTKTLVLHQTEKLSKNLKSAKQVAIAHKQKPFYPVIKRYEDVANITTKSSTKLKVLAIKQTKIQGLAEHKMGQTKLRLLAEQKPKHIIKRYEDVANITVKHPNKLKVLAERKVKYSTKLTTLAEHKLKQTKLKVLSERKSKHPTKKAYAALNTRTEIDIVPDEV